MDRGPPPAQAKLGRGTPIVGERALLGIRVGRHPALNIGKSTPPRGRGNVFLLGIPFHGT